MISNLVSKLWKGNSDATQNISESSDKPMTPDKPAPAEPPMLFARNPHRTYEAIPIAKFALNECSDDFLTDFRKVISWCIDNCKDARDHRSSFRMAPEPYGLEAGADKSELLAHAEAVVSKNIEGWKWLYPNLSDVDSKLMLLSVVAYRSIGWRYVKLPLDNPDFWGLMHRLAYLENETGQQTLQSGFIRLSKMDLHPFEFDIRLFSDAFGVFNEFIYSQYTYRGRGQLIAPRYNDYVFDCGACFGGTSLAFADRVGPQGKVFSFEFFPENLKVFNLNLQQNPSLAERIEILQAPVWHHAGKELSIANSGPATAVYEDGARSELRFTSVKIDDVVRERNLPRVDFIKMDIEGAEFYALNGAENTLREFKPRIAACVYHKLIDFFEIPQFLHGLNLGYKFYLQHSTVHGDETVLFAQAQD